MDIVCISSVDWEPLWTRKQQIMYRIPSPHRILYVEPPISFLSPYKDPQVSFKKDLSRVGIRPLNERIWLWSPPVVLPFGSRFPGFNAVNQKMMAREIKKVLQELGFKDVVLWTYLHTSCDLVNQLDEVMVVYDCVDEHSAYDNFSPELVQAMERRLLAQCDLVFTTARGLYESKKEFSREIYLSPNAADIRHFIKADRDETPVAADIRHLPHPILGFIGAIKEWIDLDLIAGVAERMPGASFVMIGPVGANVDRGRAGELPNVHFLGHRDRQVLPQYLKGFDLCLNPFKENELTATVSPLKFYEYLASGRPIVSVPMPEIMDFAGMVEFGRGVEGFTAAIGRGLQDTPEKKAARCRRARDNSWENRARFMLDIIEPRYEEKMAGIKR